MLNEVKAGLPILTFPEQGAWEAWLRQHFSDAEGVWLKIAKKGAGVMTVNYDEALEVALCFGWIDSQISAYDRQYYLHKFSLRRPKSKWSKVNREKAEALIAAGRMQPAGLKQVELARADGRWEAAYDPQSQIEVPEDLQRELDLNPPAKAFFSSLNAVNRYAILHRIQDAKKPETRLARIRKFVEMLSRKEKIYP